MGKLIWIASYPKSGNTWVRAFLHNYIRQGDAPYDINRLTDLTAADVNAERYRRYDPRPASQYAIADVQRMRRLVHRDLMGLDTTLVFVKTHNARMDIAGAPLITPEATAGAIYVVRDPRDIAVSYSAHLGRSLDETIDRMADPEAATGGTDAKVYELHSSWSAHVRSWLNPPDPMVPALRYEALAAAPEAVFGRLIEWLGQPPTAERLSRGDPVQRVQRIAGAGAGQGLRRARGAIDGAVLRAWPAGPLAPRPRPCAAGADRARSWSDDGGVRLHMTQASHSRKKGRPLRTAPLCRKARSRRYSAAFTSSVIAGVPRDSVR